MLHNLCQKGNILFRLMIKDRLLQEFTMVYLSTSSIFDPILFNLYVHDLSESSTGECLQFSDGTTLYRHCKVKHITEIARLLEASLNTLESWSKKPNLVFNTDKTKTILFSTRQISQKNNVDNTELYTIRSKDIITERVVTWKVLGKKNFIKIVAGKMKLLH